MLDSDVEDFGCDWLVMYDISVYMKFLFGVNSGEFSNLVIVVS